MEKKPIMDLKIDFNGPVVSLKGEVADVVMIPFKGTVKGEIFNGIIEPCGVDTQVLNAVKVRHMSARYMLTGRDSAGDPDIIGGDSAPAGSKERATVDWFNSNPAHFSDCYERRQINDTA